ncbi:MAG: cell surface protein SprA [bacterium]
MRRFTLLFLGLFCQSMLWASAGESSFFGSSLLPPDTIFPDTTLIYPFTEEMVDPMIGNVHPLYLDNPSNIKTEIVFDPATNQYVKIYTVGDQTYRIPTTLSFEDFQTEDMETMIQNYWKERAEAANIDNSGGLIPKIHIPGKVFETIFGNNTVDIRPQGSAEIKFGIVSNRRDDPALNTKQRRQTNFDFDERIQMNVIAKIGDKIEFRASYNTEATFDFENTLKLKYEGKEDDIIQLIEAGNVNMPLSSTLIRGTEALFGIKTKLRFGRTTVTALYSQQESETKNITVQGNAQTTEFIIRADEYEENRHFFLAQYFRDHYKEALKKLPIINSNVNILRIEVWATNIGAAVTENRNIVAFQDLGENDPYNKYNFHGIPGNYRPTNNSNDLYQRIMPTPADSANARNINTVSDYLKGPPFFLVSGIDYEKIESARKLLPSEYTFNSKVGFLSLNTSLNPDQILAVTFQYQIVGDTTVYQVGEFSDGGINSPQCLIVKLLKSTALNTRIPMWKLMMKNVYPLGAYQIQPNDFTLNILYSGNANGVPTAYLEETRVKGVPLIQVLNFDNLNMQLNPPSDGMFDFLDNAATMGGTIQSSNGRVFFTVLEPFGQDLRDSIFDPADPTGSLELADRYCFDSLYTVTKTMAKQYPDKNKFALNGFYKATAGSEISLNALNVPQGSVRVYAGGILLTENADYFVDYTLGRIRITNEGILNSGTPINISLESNELFNIQTKRLMGANVDFKLNKDFRIGATVLNLNEKPLTQKVNYGDEPISNTIWGFNLTYRKESRLLTRLIDALPLITTKAPSNVSVDAEFAQFIPGHSKAIGKAGTTYIDDFEGAKSTIDLRNVGTWFLASTPQGQTLANMFPEAAPGTGLVYGFNRAQVAWYVIDPLFYDRNTSLMPPNVTRTELSTQYVRQIWESEVFPNKEPLNGVPVNLAVLNMAYYPSDRGSYNYDVLPTGISKGIGEDGFLKEPQTRWGGIMRRIESSDFDAANIQYIEFWMMDPFVYDSTNSGELYFNLGDISEDMLQDGRKSFENGLPTSEVVTNVDTTIWGRVPSVQSLVEAFDNNPASRPYQDVGYDGLRDFDELSFFDTSYVAKLDAAYGPASPAYQQAAVDPAADDYHYFRGTDYDNNPIYGSVLARYEKFNNPEGNSPTAESSPEPYPTLATTLPNVEDINKDNTLSESERYYQYVVHLRPDKMLPGMNFITDVYEATDIPLADGSRGHVKWYQFKIPIRQPDKVVGDINGYTSIRFMRVFFKGFRKEIVCRFATLELTREEWRNYNYSLLAPGEYIPDEYQNQTTFDISTVSIEENGSMEPIPYVMPPGIDRETNWASTNFQQLNEQSMALNICNLVDGDARAAYKTTEFDFRQFKRLKMFVHAQQQIVSQDLKEGDLTVFIRIGSDFTQNFYEYEIPLMFTPWDVSADDAYTIWPESNAFDISLERLVQVKYDRIIAMREPGSKLTASMPYVEYDGRNKITVIGSPTISDVGAIMIGIRNPKKTIDSPDDDGQAKCAQIWVDELRLNDFNKKGGWAAIARVAADLADLGRVQLIGSYSSAGFSTIERKTTQRPMEATSLFGFDTDLELGKFFPERTGIRIPMHFDYSLQKIAPLYDPLNPDLYLKDVVNAMPTQEQKDSIRMLSLDHTERKNFNLMNVRKDRTTDKKPRPYDIENLNASYAYSETFHRNVDISYELRKQYAGGIGYNYAFLPKNVTPFSRSKFLSKTKMLQLVKDFNFYFIPKSFSFRTDMIRVYDQRQFRNKSRAIVPMETFYIKRWDWSRIYDLKYDFSRSLRLTWAATAGSFINEPPGKIDKSDRQMIWDEIFSIGTMNTYNQTASITWEVPFSKIPVLNFIAVAAGYQSGYRWSASPISIQSQLGNVIENNVTYALNGSLNMLTLYNNIPYLKKINQGANKQLKQKSALPDKPGRDPKQMQTQATDSLQLTKPKFYVGKLLLDGFLRILMGVRKVTFQYTQGHGIMLPGFMPEPDFMGINLSMNAPGLGFVFGEQKDIRPKAQDRVWMTLDTLLNKAYNVKFNENLSITANIEPIKDLRIEVMATKQQSNYRQEFWKANSLGQFNSYSPQMNGSYTMTYIIIGTSFSDKDVDNISSLFEKMKASRLLIAQRYAAQNPWSQGTDSTGYPNGYSGTNQDVLATAFLATYKGQDPAKIGLGAFPKIPLPNWRIIYDGLSKIKFLQKFLRNLTLSHAYIATYSVGSYISNILYRGKDGYPYILDPAGDFISERDLTVITINEQFNPLIRFDMGWVNSLLTTFEIRRTRNLSFSFVNNQLTEIKSTEYVAGIGYRFKNIRLNFSGIFGGKKAKTSSDLNIKLDFAIRQNKTTLRRVDEDINQISTGQQRLSINFSADYNLSARFNIRFYFDKDIMTPYVSNQYRTSNTQGGLALRFTLSQ